MPGKRGRSPSSSNSSSVVILDDNPTPAQSGAPLAPRPGPAQAVGQQEPQRPYHGEAKCVARKQSGAVCGKAAYYWQDTSARCGTHSRSGRREELRPDPRGPERRAAEYREHLASVQRAKVANAAAGVAGRVMCSRLRMMRSPGVVPGFLNVFPNFKHGGRSDGLGLPTLSPMSLGPVHHNQPGLPPSRNLENLHQGNKVYADELDAAGGPTAAFTAAQLAMYNDRVPHRHRDGRRGQRPAFSAWRTAPPAAAIATEPASPASPVVPAGGAQHDQNTPAGQAPPREEGEQAAEPPFIMHHMEYVPSRQFYCNYYERLAEPLPALAQLRGLLREGTNLRIVGFDAPDIGDDAPPVAPAGGLPEAPVGVAAGAGDAAAGRGDAQRRSCEEWYLDRSWPFGHELVLYTMLTEQDPARYPWRLHKTFDF